MRRPKWRKVLRILDDLIYAAGELACIELPENEQAPVEVNILTFQ